MTTKQVSKGKEEKPPLSKGKEVKSERPKSSHLADLEASFDRDARRIRPFALVGLDTQGEQPGPEPTTPNSPIPSTPPTSAVGGSASASVPVSPEAAASSVTPKVAPVVAEEGDQLRRLEEVVEVPLDRLVPSPDQPRSEVDPSAAQELLESIRAYGVLTPIQIRPVEEGKYEVVAGERRWRACALLGKPSIPALVRRKDRDRAAAEALIDNVVRKDLSALEEAKAYQALIERYGFQQSELAERLGCHKSRISKALSILKLPETILNVFFGPESHMTAAHAEALLPLAHDEPRLHAIARRASKESWTRDRIRQEIDRKPRINEGAQAVRFVERGRGGDRGFMLTILFHSNKPHEIPMIEEALKQASERIQEFRDKLT